MLEEADDSINRANERLKAEKKGEDTWRNKEVDGKSPPELLPKESPNDNNSSKEENPSPKVLLQTGKIKSSFNGDIFSKTEF